MKHTSVLTLGPGRPGYFFMLEEQEEKGVHKRNTRTGWTTWTTDDGFFRQRQWQCEELLGVARVSYHVAQVRLQFAGDLRFHANTLWFGSDNTRIFGNPQKAVTIPTRFPGKSPLKSNRLGTRRSALLNPSPTTFALLTP